MVIVTSGGKEFYMDGGLKANLDSVVNEVRDDSDAIFLVTGRERTGKSVFAMQLAKYVDPTFCFDRLCFTPQEFKKCVINSPQKYSAVVWDEALSGVKASNWAYEVNKGIVQLLSEVGQRNLIIFIVLPNFFETSKYIGIHRSTALLHVYRGPDGRRGRFLGYGWGTKKKLHLLGSKTYNYNAVKSDFYGRFTNFYTLDEGAYRKRKYDALKNREEDEKRMRGPAPITIKHKKQRDVLIKLLREEFKVPAPQLVAVLNNHGVGMDKKQIYEVCRGMVDYSGTGV